MARMCPTSQEWIGQSFGLLLQVVNICSLLVVPVTVINLKRDHLGPGRGTLATFFYTVLFLKLWSYVQVDNWHHCAVLWNSVAKFPWFR